MANSQKPKKANSFIEVLASLAGGGSPGGKPPKRPSSSLMGQLIRQRQMQGNPESPQSPVQEAKWLLIAALVIFLSILALSIFLSP